MTKGTSGKKTAAKTAGRTKTAEKPVKREPVKAGSSVKPAAAVQPQQACVPNIDYSLCQGCGGCAEAFPRLFEMRGERAWVIGPETYDPVRDAGILTICPYYAISIEKV